ncbi:hypothetical protein QJS10_CPB14g01345 [Acorus calamus]|uniref:Disease resistance N-terminal domain-containing protein n=1 Tax=Acorus calamus TaxID=4465 RepID=A0AAV9DDD3_ACOCL|nr:hypothetical protein QJS10_CPB14g01345 [Acorus calamus]
MAMIVDPFASHIAQILCDNAKEEVAMLLEVDVELQKLKGTLEMIQRVLKDAERKGIQDWAIALWLRNLEDVMYDAGDVMDHCMIKGERLLVQQQASFIPWAFVSIRWEIIHFTRSRREGGLECTTIGQPVTRRCIVSEVLRSWV